MCGQRDESSFTRNGTGSDCMGQQGQGLAVNPETPEKWLHADHMTHKGLVLLLCSPASSFMTGTTLAIDGGIMAK